MAWVRIDDHLPDHDKLAHCGDYAPLCGWLFVCALAYCNRQLTDGRIPKPHIHKLANFRHVHVETASIGRGADKLASFTDDITCDRLADILVDVGLWEVDGEYFVIHDYLDYQPSRADVDAQRAALSEKRRDAGRKGAEGRWVHGKHGKPDGKPSDLYGKNGKQDGKRYGKRMAPIPIDQDLVCVQDNTPEPPPSVLADDVWQLWRTVADEHRAPVRLGASPTQTTHLLALAGAYTLDELGAALRAWWASPFVTGRNLGLFVSQVDEVLAYLHASDGVVGPHYRRHFRQPADKAPARAPAQVPYRSHADWVCPHEPHCGARRACETRQALDAERAKAAAP